MNIIQSITDAKYREEWNKVASHPLQTWEWGEIKEQSGNKLLRLAETNSKGKFEAVYLFTLHSLPLGRVLLNYAKGSWLSNEIFSYLKQSYGQKALLVKLEPEVFMEEAGKYHLPILKKTWADNGLRFSISSSPIFARHTFIVNLDQSEAELLSGMKSKTRYNLNLARRKGVEIKDETDNPEGFDIFFSLYQETIKRQNYLGHNRQYHRLVWETMKKKSWARILVAYYQGQPLSAYTLFLYGDYGYYLYGGSSEIHKEVMASNLLMWEAILLTKKLGRKYFDMWGALEENPNPKHPWAGFHRFKEGFGGVHKSYLPTIDLVFNRLEYSFFSVLWPLRTKILEFIRSFSRG